MIVLALACLTLVGSLQAQETAATSIEPDGESGSPSISDDGRFIVFESRASNFVAGDQPDSWDVFLFDRESGEVVRISDATPLDAGLPQLSGDGNWIVFVQAEAGQSLSGPGVTAGTIRQPWTVGLYERTSRNLRWIGVAGPTSWTGSCPRRPSIARDGSRVVFGALNGDIEVARLWARASGKLEIASLGNDGQVPTEDAYDPWISRSGRFVVFSTPSRSMAEQPSTPGLDKTWFWAGGDYVLVRDLEARTTRYASHLAFFHTTYPHFVRSRVSDDGRYVAYNHDDSRGMGAPHIGLVSDLSVDKGMRLLPEPEAGANYWWQGELEITWLSADGLTVLVHGSGLRDRPMPGEMVPDQIYLRVLASDTWTSVTLSSDGWPANGHCDQAVASADVSVIAYRSSATNLVDDDADNAVPDVFVLDRKSSKTTRIVPRPPR